MIYPLVFDNLAFPLLDRLNRTSITKKLEFLAKAERFSESQLLEIQYSKLDRLLSYTRQNSDFYSGLWRAADQDKRVASRYAALDGLPVINKHDLRGALRGFPLVAFRGRFSTVQTSGSTGVPMTFFRSAEQESWFWALRIRCWEWAGFRMGEPYLAINLNRRDAWKKRLQDLLFRCTYLTYNADTQDSARICDLLRRRGIVHINAFGSTLLVLAQHMKQWGIPNPGVRVLTSTGDNLFPAQRELIESVFGVPVTDYYGAGGEGMHLAAQCEQHDLYHVLMENSVVEIIRDGRPARPGEVGTIVVTQLDNYAMPLIRYDLGDLATVADERRCSCGREHQTIRSINGRACDLVFTPNGQVLLPQFFFIGPFKTLEKIARYQIVQDRIERISILLVPESGCNREACEAQLVTGISEATGGSLEVDFEWVSEIPLSGLGKPRPVISRLSGDPSRSMLKLGGRPST